MNTQTPSLVDAQEAVLGALRFKSTPITYFHPWKPELQALTLTLLHSLAPQHEHNAAALLRQGSQGRAREALPALACKVPRSKPNNQRSCPSTGLHADGMLCQFHRSISP